MKRRILLFLVLFIVIAFSEITIQNPVNNSEVAGIISYNWTENLSSKNITYWELFCDDNLISKVTKPHYDWNPESESYPKVDGWHNITIKAFDKNAKVVDESGINIYIKHHKLVLKLLERTQSVSNDIRFKVASINIYNGADFPIVDRAQIQLHSQSGSFSLSETNWSTITSVYIDPGHKESKIIYYRSFKAGYKKIVAEREHWGSTYATVYFYPLQVSKIVKSSDIYYINGFSTSNKVRIAFEDKFNNLVQLKKDEKLNVYMLDKNGEVSTDGKNWKRDFIIAKKGSSYLNLYYRNLKKDYEDSIIIISHPGWKSTLLNVHIRSKPTTLKLILNNNKIDLNEITYGNILVLDSKGRDSYLPKSQTIDVYSTSRNGRFATKDGWYPSIRFTMEPFSMMSQSFFYKDTLTGTQTIIIKSSLKNENANIGVANIVSKLVCDNCKNLTTAGVPLKITVTTANKYGTPVLAPGNTKLMLKAAHGKFYKTKKLLKPINTVSFPSDSSTITLYYYNTLSGKDGIAIYEYPDRGWKNIYNEINVDPAAPYTIKTTPVATIETNHTNLVKFEILDKYGNPSALSTGFDIKLSSDSSSVTFNNKSFHIDSYKGSFKFKQAKIGTATLKLTSNFKDKKITKNINILSQGYLKANSTKYVSKAGEKKTIYLYFTDDSKKKIKSIRNIKPVYNLSDNKLITSVDSAYNGYRVTVSSTKAGMYSISFKRNKFIKNDLTFKLNVLPSKVNKITVLPDKITKKIDPGQILKFSVSAFDKYGNIYNIDSKYSINLKSDIGKFFNLEKKEISLLQFNNPKNRSVSFLFKPTKFGTSTIKLIDFKSKITKSIPISTKVSPLISIPSTTTIKNTSLITIKLVNSKGEQIKTLSDISIKLSSSSGNFYQNNNPIKTAIIKQGLSSVKFYYKNTNPGTSTLSFSLLGITITKKIYVKDVPILTSFKLTPQSRKFVVGKKIGFVLTAYDQHKNPIKLSKEKKITPIISKDIKLFVNNTAVSSTITFYKNKSSLTIQSYSTKAGTKNIKFKIEGYKNIEYSFNLLPDKTSKLTLVATKQKYKIYKKSYPIKINFEDAYGNITKLSTPVLITFKSNNDTKFYTLANKEITSVSTSSSFAFYIMPTRKGTDTLTISAKIFKPITMVIYAHTYPYTFKSDSVQPFSMGEMSRPVSIYLVDKNNDYVKANKNITVNLKTDSVSGVFYNDKKEKNNKILILKGSYKTYFYYMDKSLGDHRITISSSLTEEPTTIILSTVKPVKNIEFRNIEKSYTVGKEYDLSVVTVNEDGIQWYVGMGATINLTSDSTSVFFLNDKNQWVKSVTLKIKPYSSSVNFKIKALKPVEVVLNAKWIDRKVNAKIRLVFIKGGKK